MLGREHAVEFYRTSTVEYLLGSEMISMLTALAYIIVVVLSQFCLTLGVFLVGFPVALLLAWAPITLRTMVAGIIGGIAGVAAAVALSYGVFRVLVGPDSFTVGPFLASTLPLLIPIRNDLIQSKRVKDARDELLQTITASRGEAAAKVMAAETTTAHGSGVIGEIAGVVLAAAWFFNR